MAEPESAASVPPLRLVLSGGLELRVWDTSKRLEAVDKYMLLAFIALFDAIESRDPTALIGLPLIAVAGLLRKAGFALP